MSMILTEAPNEALGVARLKDQVRPSGSRASFEASLQRPPSLYTRWGKRALDVMVSSMMLLMVAPLLLVLAAVVALDGGRPFFAHRRVGLGGAFFPCLKVRSMRHGAEAELKRILAEDPEAAAEWAETHKLNNDPRVTAVGRFLRRSSLDELPQLVNVLRGEMSIVGPRPVTYDELAKYGTSADAYLALKPGLTGPWQVDGRNELSYDERVALDAGYADNMTLVGDVTIILKTGLSVLKLTGK